MNAEARLTDLCTALSIYTETKNPVPHPAIEHWLTQLYQLAAEFRTIKTAIEHIADVSDAMMLLTQLLDAAHTDELDADQMRSLLNPLRDKLESALDGARRVG